MTPTALNFDLQISPDGDAYRAEVVASPSGTPTARFVLPLSPADQDGFIGQLLNESNRRSALFTEGMVKTFGRQLFETVFQGEILASFLRSRDRAEADGVNLRLRLRLNNVPALLNLPWEFLFDPNRGQFLAHAARNPLIHFLHLPDPPRPTRTALPLRALIATAGPDGLEPLDADAEFAQVTEAVAAMTEAKQMVLERMDDASYEGLQRRLADTRNPVHVLHFVGHGHFDPQADDGGQGSVVLCDADGGPDLVSADALGRIVLNARGLRLVLLNACEGSRTGTADPFAGVAQTLVQQGIPAVVAMQFAITDSAAIAFAHAFYTGLADGQPIDTALTHARVAISRLPGSEWGTPRLFMNSPDGLLWDLAQTDKTRLAIAQQDVRHTDAGLNALVDMMQNPGVRDTVVAFRTDLEAASRQLELLASLKELHDHLHNVEFRRFRVIETQIRRFPDDDVAVMTLEDQEQDLLDRLRKIQEAVAHPTLAQEEIAWVADLAEADSLLQDAVTTLQPKPLKRCVRLLGRLLTREPSRINDRLNHTAVNLRLDKIVQALSAITAKLREVQAEGQLDGDRLDQLEQGVGALARFSTTR